MTAASVLTKPKDPEKAALVTPPRAGGPIRKLPARPRIGRNESTASKENPTCGGVMAGCAYAEAQRVKRAMAGFSYGCSR
jgi:hypothetical protein